MELSFVASALKRYWWFVVLMVVLGALPGLLLAGGEAPEYQSNAVLLIRPPTDASGATGGGDPDRYVAGQLSVLRSEGMAENVAAALGEESVGAVGSSVSFEREPSTDIVTIVSRGADPERARELGQAYLDVYFETVRAQVAGTQEPEVARLDEQIDALRTEIEDVNLQIRDRMAPYLQRDPIPTAESIAPELSTEVGLLVSQLDDLLEARSSIDTARLRVASEIVQRPTLAVAPIPTPPNTLLFLGIIGGGFAGFVGAVALARISPTVLGDVQAEEILRQPVVGVVPELPRLRDDRAAVLEEAPAKAADIIKALCVRAETMGYDQGTASILVVSTERGAGATTVAALVARRFASSGARTLLVDADRRDPELTALTDRHLDLTAPGDGVGTPTTIPNLRFLNVNDLLLSLGGDTRFRSTPVGELLRSATRGSDIVVYDGGPVMESAGILRMARVADAVILVMPSRQRAQALDTIASELRGRPLLPVWVQKSRQLPTFPRRRPPRPPSPTETAPDLVGSLTGSDG